MAIKRETNEAPILKSLDFSKPFQIFSFASFHAVVVVMLQKNKEGFEQPNVFFSKSLQATESKYDMVEKKSYALVKAIKTFRPYLVGVEIIAYVPNTIVKDIFLFK